MLLLKKQINVSPILHKNTSLPRKENNVDFLVYSS